MSYWSSGHLVDLYDTKLERDLSSVKPSRGQYLEKLRL